MRNMQYAICNMEVAQRFPATPGVGGSQQGNARNYLAKTKILGVDWLTGPADSECTNPDNCQGETNVMTRNSGKI